MSLYELKGKLEKASRDPITSSILQTMWIKIHKVPDIAREVDVVKEIASLVAEPLVVDELSLIRDGPVRFQGRCRSPDATNGGIEYFFNGTGITLIFKVENTHGRGEKGQGWASWTM